MHVDILLYLWSASIAKLNRHTCNLKKTLTSPLLDCSVPCLTYSGVVFISWVTVLCCYTDKYITADTVIVSSRDNPRVVPTSRRDELLLLVFFVSTSWNLDTEFKFLLTSIFSMTCQTSEQKALKNVQDFNWSVIIKGCEQRMIPHTSID